MNYLGRVALMLGFGVAVIHAQQVPVNMAMSGSAANSTVDLGIGTPTSEYNLTGDGLLGAFTLRVVSASTPAPQPSTCSGANKIYGVVAAGAGVFRAPDGSLLTLNLTGGSDCIDLSAGHATCIRIFQVAGGTGHFKNASGSNLTLTMIVTPVVPTNPVFFSVTADITGTLSQ